MSLAEIDPTKPVTANQSRTIQSIINNQSEVVLESIYFFNPKAGTIKYIDITKKEKELSDLKLDPDDYKINDELMKFIAPEIGNHSFILRNLSKINHSPVLGIIIPDFSLKGKSDEIPMVLGIIPLNSVGSDLRNIKLTIATRSGWVLYDTDPAILFSKINISYHPLFQVAKSSRLSTGAQEYNFQNNHLLGSYVLPGFDLVVLSETEWHTAMRATYMVVEKFLLLGIIAVGCSIIFAILFAKTLTAPLGRLYEAIKEVGSGNFLFQVEEKGRDELSALSRYFNIMASKINELVREHIDKVRIEDELMIASTVQQNLIPPTDFQNKMLEIFSHYQSALQCGGDWWGFFGVGNKVAIMIADATGHGFPSALVTASARSCFSIMHKLAQEDPEFSFSPSAMLSYANRAVFDAAGGKIMMTFFVGVMDFKEKKITYSSAGHNPPWLFRQNGDQYELKSLNTIGQRLGEVRDLNSFEEKTAEMKQGDIIFLYTDGLIEGRNEIGEMYSKNRVRKFLEANLVNGPQSTLSFLINDFLSHNQGKHLDDDVTVAIVRILTVGENLS
jgi:sigma-B regulation protein RsbU (phosphoserine phosphatase)